MSVKTSQKLAWWIASTISDGSVQDLDWSTGSIKPIFHQLNVNCYIQYLKWSDHINNTFTIVPRLPYHISHSSSSPVPQCSVKGCAFTHIVFLFALSFILLSKSLLFPVELLRPVDKIRPNSGGLTMSKYYASCGTIFYPSDKLKLSPKYQSSTVFLSQIPDVKSSVTFLVQLRIWYHSYPTLCCRNAYLWLNLVCQLYRNKVIVWYFPNDTSRSFSSQNLLNLLQIQSPLCRKYTS